jgi:hypothetical protein
MDVSLVFDTEDYTSPPEWGMDDIPKWMAEIMTEEGLVGSFLVIGNKARSMRARGRGDAIAAMRKHEIGLHTNFGSDHPTLVESQSPHDWHEAVKHADERETPGLVELGEIFDAKIGSASTHGASQTASMHYVSGTQWKLPWLYSFVPTPSENLCWYADCFQLGLDHVGINEAWYSQPKKVDETLARWKTQIDGYVKGGRKWIYIFMAHPLMVRAKQFNDALNYADGKNRIPWRTPEMRTLEEMEVAKQQFRRVIRWIAKHPKLNNITLHQTQEKYGKKKPRITKAELAAFCARAGAHQAILTGYTFSPAEALHAVCEGLLAKSLPAASAVKTVLGPAGESSRMPDNALEWIGNTEVKALAKGVLDAVKRTGMLPSHLPTPNGGGRMGLPAVFHALVAAWNQSLAGQAEWRVRVTHICGRYPNGAEATEASFRRSWLNWPIHDIHMPLENLSRHVRLQSWTWKTIYDGKDTPTHAD